jgi:hypothetical protein
VSGPARGGLTGIARAQVDARVLDLSLGGALLNVQTSFEVGTIGDFAVPLEGAPLWVQAEVRRCTPVEGGYEVALEFVGMHPRDQRRLAEYLARG